MNLRPIVMAGALMLAPSAVTGEERETPDEPSPSIVREAELPEGFPEPGPPGEVVTKRYPAYRVARTDGGRSAFFRLFAHIRKHDIAMTAPVEMTLAADGAGDSAEPRDEAAAGHHVAEMMFMYGDPSMGELGADGPVEVVDVEAMEVLSVGWFGGQAGEAAADAMRRLQAALAERTNLEAVGPMRVLGYNSPQVPADQRFFEVQVPVSVAADESTDD